ncbi:MAG: hypothetical protein WDA42_05205, partial [Candidatus Bathyarchaeia archaeon]
WAEFPQSPNWGPIATHQLTSPLRCLAAWEIKIGACFHSYYCQARWVRNVVSHPRLTPPNIEDEDKN